MHKAGENTDHSRAVAEALPHHIDRHYGEALSPMGSTSQSQLFADIPQRSPLHQQILIQVSAKKQGDESSLRGFDAKPFTERCTVIGLHHLQEAINLVDDQERCRGLLEFVKSYLFNGEFDEKAPAADVDHFLVVALDTLPKREKAAFYAGIAPISRRLPLTDDAMMNDIAGCSFEQRKQIFASLAPNLTSISEDRRWDAVRGVITHFATGAHEDMVRFNALLSKLEAIPDERLVDLHDIIVAQIAGHTGPKRRDILIQVRTAMRQAKRTEIGAPRADLVSEILLRLNTALVPLAGEIDAQCSAALMEQIRLGGENGTITNERWLKRLITNAMGLATVQQTSDVLDAAEWAIRDARAPEPDKTQSRGNSLMKNQIQKLARNTTFTNRKREALRQVRAAQDALTGERR